MNFETGQIRIRKRSFPQWLSLGIFVFPFLLSFFIIILKFPSAVKYIVDFFWVLSAAILFIGKRVALKRNVAPLFWLVLAWLLYVVVVYAFNFQSVFYFLWGIRNNFRFYIAFFAFVTFLDKGDIDFSFKFVEALFWINIPLTLYQFFVLGYRQDYLGGIFGTERGCNAYTMILLLAVVLKSLLNSYEKKEGMGICMLKSGLSLIMAALTELKFYFILFVLIVIVAMLMTRFSWRKLVAMISFAVLISFSMSILTALFDSNGDLSFQSILNLIFTENYSSSEDLGRFTSIPRLSKEILTDWLSQMFGMGLGNCDTSAFSICNTPFYQAHEYLHYTWFSSAILFLETGYIGLLLNLSFYLTAMILSIKKLKQGHGNKIYCQMAIVFAGLCMILTFYNSTLRKEVGYIAYFMLSLPFISDSGDNEIVTECS